MHPTRRALLIGAALIAACPARAVSAPEAETFVRGVAADLLDIVQGASVGDTRAEKFLALFRRVAALPQIGRFTIGAAWRRMSAQQQQAYLAAFERYAARAYAGRVGEYAGQTLTVVGSQDAGQRGVLVRSVLKANGQQDVQVDWLVSDRGGDLRVVDIVAEGVSLSISQREEFAAMLEKRGGDVDRFIADLGN